MNWNQLHTTLSHTASTMQTGHTAETESMNDKTLEYSKVDNVGTSPSPSPDGEPGKEQKLVMEMTTEQVIGEISYSESSSELQTNMSLGEIPPNFKPIETSSVVSELPELSHTPDRTLTNNSNISSGSSPPQQSSEMDKNNIELTNTISPESSGSSQTRCNHLKTCIIRLTELSNQEREQ